MQHQQGHEDDGRMAGDALMGWARVDDGYLGHPKILEAGVWAELLDLRSIIWCAKYETDGLVTRSALQSIGRGIPKVSTRVLSLIDVGRWTVNEGGGWWVHDFLTYNPSKAEKETQRAQGRERVRKHRLSTSGNAVTNASHPKGRGGESVPTPKVLARCRRCDRLSVDCQCPPLELVEEA